MAAIATGENAQSRAHTEHLATLTVATLAVTTVGAWVMGAALNGAKPPAGPREPSDMICTYTIDAGDTVTGFAERTGAGVEELRSLNELGDKWIIYAGGTFRAPCAEGGTPETPQPTEASKTAKN